MSPTATQTALQVPATGDGSKESALAENSLNESGSIGDVSGITGVGRGPETVRLISQFGLLTVFAAAILLACGSLLWFVLNTVRADALNEFQRQREDHQKQWQTQREDHKSDRAEMRDSIKALWSNSRALTDALDEANKNAAKVIEVGNRQLILMEKIVNKMP
jgi:hypothetical protein